MRMASNELVLNLAVNKVLKKKLFYCNDEDITVNIYRNAEVVFSRKKYNIRFMERKLREMVEYERCKTAKNSVAKAMAFDEDLEERVAQKVAYLSALFVEVSYLI